jgi:hypothetical protein
VLDALEEAVGAGTSPGECRECLAMRDIHDTRQAGSCSAAPARSPRTADLTSHLFETRDTLEAVKSFLEHGPGKADFTAE